ncbi:MAG: Arm DNA-binding domain-containing protein [Mariprofundus sp.]|nr:Arm DNA-binding domain-containing protein [Mariprofundus sp.]
MALSDAEIQATKVPYGKNQFKVSDGAGLYLLVKSSGRYWKLAYRFEGKQKTLAFGVYPAVSIEQAREKRDSAKQLLAQHIDPGEIRKQQRLEQRQTNIVDASPAPSSHVSNEKLIPQPVFIDPVVQKNMQQRRLCILQTLESAKAYSADERGLQGALDAQGWRISFDRLRTDIAWLYEQQVVQIETPMHTAAHTEAQTDTLWVIRLTQSGLDAAQGRMWIPGIARPATDQTEQSV